MSKCCIWHDALPEIAEPGAEPGCDECGLAGSGKPYICCASCPEIAHFVKRYGMQASDFNFVRELVEQS